MWKGAQQTPNTATTIATVAKRMKETIVFYCCRLNTFPPAVPFDKKNGKTWVVHVIRTSLHVQIDTENPDCGSFFL